MRKQFSKVKPPLNFQNREERASKIAYSKIKNKYLAQSFDIDEFTATDDELQYKLPLDIHSKIHWN